MSLHSFPQVCGIDIFITPAKVYSFPILSYANYMQSLSNISTWTKCNEIIKVVLMLACTYLDLEQKMNWIYINTFIISIMMLLTKRLKKKLDGYYTRMLRAILNKSWRQHPTRHQLYGRLPPITKTIQVRRTRHAGHCWRSKDELRSDILLWTPRMWPSKSRTTSSNIRTAAMWGYGM